MKLTAIVILNWNGKHFLADLLPFVIRYSDEDVEIIVADNASTDGSIEWLQNSYPGIRFIQNESNGGFAKGYNDALANLEHKYFVLLNSDIEVTEGWLTPLIARMESDQRIFAVQPKLLSYHQRTQFEYAGAAGGFIDYLGFPFCRGRIFATYEQDQGQYDQPVSIFWATGACMVVRAAIFKSLGGFDEEFFAHMEEIDLCWRAQNEGYKIVCEPSSTVFHIGGGTLPKKSTQKTYLNFRNNLLSLHKNLPSSDFARIIIQKMILDGVAALKFLVEGEYGDFRAVFRAHLYFYRRLFRKGKSPKRNKLSTLTGVYKGSIVIEHYVRKVNKFSSLTKSRFTGYSDELH